MAKNKINKYQVSLKVNPSVSTGTVGRSRTVTIDMSSRKRMVVSDWDDTRKQYSFVILKDSDSNESEFDMSQEAILGKIMKRSAYRILREEVQKRLKKIFSDTRIPNVGFAKMVK